MPEIHPLPSDPFRNTRSASRGRGRRGGPSTASAYSKTQTCLRPGALAPVLASKLPVARTAVQQHKVNSVSNRNITSKNMNSNSDNTGGLSTQANLGTLKQAHDLNQVSPPDDVTRPLATAPQVGDNTAPGNIPAASSTAPPTMTKQVNELYWHKALEELRGFATQTCQELKVIGNKLEKLDKIELSTDTLAKQMTGVLERTSVLEEVSAQNSNEIKSLKEDVQSLRATIAAQEEVITDLKTIKKDFIKINAEFNKTSNDKVKEFSDLIGVQQKQVDAFHATNQKIQDTIQDNVKQHVDDTIKTWTDASDLRALKDQASRNKNNLVIVGLEEEDKPPVETASKFIKSTLAIKNVHVDVAYRLGPPPPEGSSYARPIWLRFTHRADRNKVWRGKTTITSEDGERKIRIQQDLPKKLREISQVLNRVLKAAAAHPKYKTAKFQDYKIRLHGRSYGPEQLERLPKPIRPSTLAVRTSESSLVFFTRHAVFSNHHPAPFTLKGLRYANMEHYLAHQRALLSEDNDLIQRALEASDPLEAKSILNSLKHDHVEQWEDRVENILLAGLRQKFKQNDSLLKYLKNTQHLELGEASKDPKWGIGMALDDPDAVDSTKWNPSGNRLGRALSKIRKEFTTDTSNGHTQADLQSHGEVGENGSKKGSGVKGDSSSKRREQHDEQGNPKEGQTPKQVDKSSQANNNEQTAVRKQAKASATTPGKSNTPSLKDKSTPPSASAPTPDKDPVEKKASKARSQGNPSATPSAQKDKRK